jgi:hypothetical protein
MEEFDISRMIQAIIIDIIVNVGIAFVLRDIVMPYISYSISIFLNVFYSLPIFNNSIANQTLYNAYFISQIICILFGAIPSALGIASLMTKLTKLLGYWSDFEENPSKAVEFALFFIALFFIGFISQLIMLIAD